MTPFRRACEFFADAALASMLAALVASVAACRHVNVAGPQPHPQNLVLIVLDTFRGDFPSYAGGPAATPTLDKLVAEGAWFRNARSNAAQTGPSHASLFTSGYTTDHGIFENGQILGPERPTLAEVLTQSGRRSAAYVSLFVLRAKFGFDRGFQSYSCQFVDQWWKDAERINAEALPWIADVGTDPFFLWLHYSDTHSPYTAPDQPYPHLSLRQDGRKERQIASDGRTVRFDLFLDNHQATLRIEPGPDGHPGHRLRSQIGGEVMRQCRLEVTEGLDGDIRGIEMELTVPAELRFTGCDQEDGELSLTLMVEAARSVEGDRRAYIQEVEYLDRQLGLIIDALAARGLLETSLIVVVGDHGEGLGDHGLLTHGQQLYDSLLKVPLIFVGPTVPAGRVVDATVSLVDVMPTIIDLMALPTPANLRGRSLVPQLEGASSEDLACVGRALASNGKYDLESLTFGEIKYIRDNKVGSHHVYDLTADPGELGDVAAERRGEVDTLSAMLETLTSGRAVTAQSGVVDEEVRRQLEALGYDTSGQAHPAE